MRNGDSFIRRVRRDLDELTATERRLAEFLLDFPGELASYAANELAELAGVSNATVSRFIRHLGYSNYEDARRHVRLEKETGSPLFQTTTHARKSGDLVATHLEHSLQNVNQTFAGFNEAQLNEIVKALIAAPQVLIFGSRSSHGFAVYLRWQIIQVLQRVIAMPGAGETLAEHLTNLTPRDCVVVFGMRRQTRVMNVVLEAAHRVGAKILFISDQLSADYAAATWSIQCQCTSPGVLDNHVAVMAFCDLLANTVIEASGVAGRRRLAAIELSHDEFDEL